MPPKDTYNETQRSTRKRGKNMVLSMTGFGRGESVEHGRDITVEIRSVNSRYFEYTSRLPRSCNFLDAALKKQLNARISRGKVELGLTIQTIDAPDSTVRVNLDLARGYAKALREISETLDVKNDANATTLARMPDVLTTVCAETDEAQLAADVAAVCGMALDHFLAMRAVEGEKMKADVLEKLSSVENMVGEIEALSAGRVESYTSRLYERLKTLLADKTIDDSRILTEAALFADKTAIDEETVRLHSHIAQYRAILAMDEPVGRKLDFLTQELNREVNTIGSKCQDLDITRLVVNLKSEIEKIREQIQNIE